MPKSRLSAVLSLLLVFLSGGVLGAFAYRLYSISPVQSSKDSAVPPKRLSPEEWRRKYVADLSNALKLDTQQVVALNVVLDGIRDELDKLNEKIKPEYDAVNNKWRPNREAIHNHQVDKINGLLRAEQRPLYEAFRAERDRLRKSRDQQDHKKQ
jgi:hypothetical protein